MSTKARYLAAALSDGLFLASVSIGTVALLLEEGSQALRALALKDLPPVTHSVGLLDSLGFDLADLDFFEDGCGPNCVDEDCDSGCGSDCCDREAVA